ncbi:MAG: DNA-binding protein [Spirosoma sp.]|nr:DNA-binding protein [Spirosoma sp.]
MFLNKDRPGGIYYQAFKQKTVECTPQLLAVLWLFRHRIYLINFFYYLTECSTLAPRKAKTFLIVDEKEQDRNYSKRVRAGKRTYFFDVKTTRANDYFITITESRRQVQGEVITYEKQKLFLYKEDFQKFVEALQETVGYVKTELLPDVDFAQFVRPENDEQSDFVSNLKWE